MRICEYKCRECELRIEAWDEVANTHPLEVCPRPECDGTLRRIYSFGGPRRFGDGHALRAVEHEGQLNYVNPANQFLVSSGNTTFYRNEFVGGGITVGPNSSVIDNSFSLTDNAIQTLPGTHSVEVRGNRFRPNG